MPVVPSAGDLNLAGLAIHIADVAGRTRDGSIKADELSGGTFSIVKRPGVATAPDGLWHQAATPAGIY